VPDTRKQVGRRLDVVGIAQLGVGLLAVMVAVSYLGSGSSSPASAMFIVPLVVGLGSIVAFVRHSGRAEHPFVPLRLLRGRGFAVMNLINFLFGSAMLGFSTLVPLYAEERFGIHVLAAGTLLTARAVGMIAIAALAVFALRRTGYRLPMIVGFLLGSVGLAMMTLDPHGVTAYTWLAVSAAVMGIGMGVALPASNNAVLQLAPENTAAVSGLRGMFRQAGGITGLSIVTAVLARSGDPGVTQAHVFVVFAVLLLALIPLVFLVPEHRGTW